MAWSGEVGGGFADVLPVDTLECPGPISLCRVEPIEISDIEEFGEDGCRPLIAREWRLGDVGVLVGTKTRPSPAT